MFGYAVPCGAWVAWVGAAVAIRSISQGYQGVSGVKAPSAAVQPIRFAVEPLFRAVSLGKATTLRPVASSGPFAFNSLTIQPLAAKPAAMRVGGP